eukprot:scaffold24025_cov137-Cylindrotheca_fusiformis.AAC.1
MPSPGSTIQSSVRTHTLWEKTILIGKNWLATFPVLLSGNGRTLAAEDPLLRFWSKHTSTTSHLPASFSTHTFEKNNNI